MLSDVFLDVIYTECCIFVLLSLVIFGLSVIMQNAIASPGLIFSNTLAIILTIELQIIAEIFVT